MDQKKNILIIEDDPNIVDLVTMHLNDTGYDVAATDNGADGLEMFQQGNYDLVILDLMLPGMDGMEVCKRIRTENDYTPVLMLTARSEELDKVLGLELGADDYITKPFSIREFIARVKATFRRMDVDQKEITADEQEVIEFGDLRIEQDKRKVVLNDQTVELTAKEFDLLTLFARNPGRTYDRGELLDIVWGYQFEGYDHTVNSHINRLRGKIEEDPSNPRFLKTVWGVGYRFAELEELEDA